MIFSDPAKQLSRRCEWVIVCAFASIEDVGGGLLFYSLSHTASIIGTGEERLEIDAYAICAI